MKTRQAKKILKEYFFTEGCIRWPLPTIMNALRVAKRRRWSVLYCALNWDLRKTRTAYGLTRRVSL